MKKATPGGGLLLLRLLARTPASAACKVARAAVVTHREEREELSGLKRLPVPFLRGTLSPPAGDPGPIGSWQTIMEWGTES